MITNFSRARMAHYDHDFFQNTTRDDTIGSVRWTAYELLIIGNFLNDDSSSEKGFLSHKSPVLPSKPAKQIEARPPFPSSDGEGQSHTDITHRHADNKIWEDNNENDDIIHHGNTKAADMWSFGMVIYVCECIPIRGVFNSF